MSDLTERSDTQAEGEVLRPSPTIKEAYDNLQWLKERGMPVPCDFDALVEIHDLLMRSCGFECKK